MELKNIIKLGESFNVEFDDKKTKTILQDIDGDIITVFEPTVKGIPIKPTGVDWVHFTFYRDNGYYSFDAMLEKTFKSENIRLCRYKIATKITKKQRRESFRLPVVLDASVRLVNVNIDGVEESTVSKVKTIDLSEGGMQFSSKNYFPVGTTIHIHVTLELYNSISVSAKVIRCSRPANESFKYNTSVQFINLASRDQSNVCRYILKKQIKQRKRV